MQAGTNARHSSQRATPADCGSSASSGGQLAWGSAQSNEFLERLDVRTRCDPLLAHQEGHFKVQVLRTALSLDYRIQEPSSRATRVYEASPSGPDGSWPHWVESDRAVRIANGSCDLMLRRGDRHLLVELKCRPDQGSKAQAAMRELRGDLERVGQDGRFVFLSVFDEKIYRSFSGGKEERRGRKPRDLELAKLFPAMALLPPSECVELRTSITDTAMHFWILRQVLRDDDSGNGPKVNCQPDVHRVFVMARRD